MDLRNLCTNCLAGTIKNGICTQCHKSIAEITQNPAGVLPAGHILGSQYYIGKVIGRGGFGITYLAWDFIGQKRVIVKELFPKEDVQRDPVSFSVIPVKGQEGYFQKCRLRFREEAQVLYSFRSEPSVLNVYRLVEENNTVYYAMEYLSGFDLRAYIRQNGVLGWPQLSVYIRRLLRTLHILHRKGLIHRDISPDNIFLLSVSDAKLIDFGSVRCYDNDKGLTTHLKHVYAPIEQYFSNGVQGPWTDIYSLSVTMYYALSGSLPPAAPERVKQDEVPKLDRLCPELPKSAAEAITRGMALRREDRFQSADDFYQALFPGESLFKPEGTAVSWRIRILSGIYRGKQISIVPNTSLTVGRDRSCELKYPAGSAGISRIHFRLQCGTDGKLFISDHSTYGTIVSGRRLEPGKLYLLQRGSYVQFAEESYYVE